MPKTKAAGFDYRSFAAYHVNYDVTANSTVYVSAFPMPSAAQDHILVQKLGANGFSRVQQFKEYPPGWNFGHGNAMSHIGLGSMCEFLNYVNLPQNVWPSVFLAGSGNLELAWEAANGGRLQAEFGPTHIEYYREDRGQEGSLKPTEALEAAKLLNA